MRTEARVKKRNKINVIALKSTFEPNESFLLTKKAKNNELKNPPMNPSHVLFGDNSISLVLPNILPKTYANMSFVMTSIAGKINHTNPVYKLETTTDVCPTTINKAR